MALHDYLCPCGETLRDQYRTIADGGMDTRPLCPKCGNLMDWIPQIGCMDAFEPGQEFVVYDGQNRPRTIESFAQMRALERESEQQARNGEGQPLRFRALHQNRSNMQDNTFGEVPQPKISSSAKHRFGLQGAASALAPVDGSAPEATYGPGVSDENASALKE